MAVIGWLVLPCALVSSLVLDRRMTALGRSDLQSLALQDFPFVVASISTVTVGAALVIRRPRHPVGWLFLGLGDLLPLAGVAEAYAAYGVVVRPGALPGAAVIGALSDTPFILWLTTLALVLHLTPTGQPLTRKWGRAAALTTTCGVIWFVAALVHPGRLAPPLDGVVNPLAISGLSAALRSASPLFVIGAAAGIPIGVASVAVRYRRARGQERSRLSWITLAALPLPVLALAVPLAAATGNEAVLAVVASTFVAVLPIAAGFSIARYHLYNVDRILSRATTYAVLCALLVASYLAAVLGLEQVLGNALGRSHLVDVGATLFAVAVTAPSYRRVQNAVDRRFNRRRFEALRRIRDYVQNPDPAIQIEDVLREALAEPSLRVAYWTEGDERWVRLDGHSGGPERDVVFVRRHGHPIARISYDREVTDPQLVEAAGAEAATELENAALRADLAQQLLEVQQSRARLTIAQLAERHKIERDLHDGAQQRLLSLALQLRAAQNGSDDRRRRTIETGIQQLQAAIAELRELANGVLPASLSSGGLIAALDDLAARSPVPTVVDATEERFSRTVEATAWFIICEAAANAVKHAQPETVEISVSGATDHLVLDVRDDGCGGADPSGSGLRGIRDRAESIGGWMTVRTDPTGTTVHAELPCVS